MIATVAEALDVLRLAGWRPGVPTGGHPARSEIKAALAVLRQHRVHDIAAALDGRAEVQPACPVCGVAPAGEAKRRGGR